MEEKPDPEEKEVALLEGAGLASLLGNSRDGFKATNPRLCGASHTFSSCCRSCVLREVEQLVFVL